MIIMCHISTGKTSGDMETAWRRTARDGGGPTPVGVRDSGLLGADMERLVSAAATEGDICGCDDYSRTRSGGKCGEAHWCTGEASAVVQPAKVGESQRATPTGNEVTCHTVAASSLGRPSTVWLWGIIAHAPHQWPSQSMDAAWRLARSSQPADPAQPSNCGIATARFGRVDSQFVLPQHGR